MRRVLRGYAKDKNGNRVEIFVDPTNGVIVGTM